MIHILYTRIQDQLPQDIFDHYLGQLPACLQQRNKRFRRWQDRHANLFGKILLQQAVRPFGIDINVLHYNKYDRPSISSEIDFNISHSGDYVMCAISQKCRLGIDIEQVRPVSFDDFKGIMTGLQWHEINKSPDPTRAFFEYWTMKESVIKADSRGLSIPLDRICMHDSELVFCEDIPWYIKRLHIDPGYCVCLASDSSEMNISMQSYSFSEENQFDQILY